MNNIKTIIIIFVIVLSGVFENKSTILNDDLINAMTYAIENMQTVLDEGNCYIK